MMLRYEYSTLGWRVQLTQVVCSDHDSLVVLDPNDTGTCNQRLSV